jgi:hypothetical protein
MSQLIHKSGQYKSCAGDLPGQFKDMSGSDAEKFGCTMADETLYDSHKTKCTNGSGWASSLDVVRGMLLLNSR